jgi:tetratricopeptide (TPR) repeat protein
MSRRTVVYALGFIAALPIGVLCGEKLPKPKRIPAPATPHQQRLIKEGIALHESGDHDGALAKYKQALAESPDQVHALHEMSLTYFAKKDYENAMALARQGAEFKSNLLPSFYATLGSGLDETGKRDEAVEIYKAAIKQVPDFPLLHYNLGLTLIRSGKHGDAKQALQKGLLLDPNHRSSHLLLGGLYREMGYRVPAILALSRFLALEPDTPRSVQVLPVLQGLIAGNVTKGDKPGHINITLSLTPDSMKDEGDFGPTEVAMSMSVAAATMEKEKKSSPYKALVATYGIIASTISSKGKGFAARYYAPYFAAIDKAEHTEAFVALAWQTGKVHGAAEWQKENEAKLHEFRSWSAGYQWSKRK